MSELPEVPPSILDPVRRYFIAFKRRLEAMLRGKADLIEGTLYISAEQPLEYIDADGTHYRMGETAIPPMAGAPWFTVQPHGARVNGVRGDGDTTQSGFIDLDAVGQPGLVVRVGRSSNTPDMMRIVLQNGDGTGAFWCNIDRDLGMSFGGPSGGQKGAGTINARQLYVHGAPVVERGSSGTGRWVKWADGTQMARMTQGGIDIDNPVGGLYKSTPVTIPAPVNFVEVWSAYAAESSSANVWAGANDVSNGVAVTLYYTGTLTGRTAVATLWGRWK